jgi:alkanesulfonate monooxygenase SsuD/methylene tetrahydromethanopterin reductase-like flavin-dependent oxidoreductase (luciferase family)
VQIVRDFLNIARCEGARAVVGSAKDIADQLEQRFVQRACDGFVVAATHIPGAFECRSPPGTRHPAGCPGGAAWMARCILRLASVMAVSCWRCSRLE